MNIGFIGAGRVAQAIAGAALKAGHKVALSNGRPSHDERLARAVESLGHGAVAVALQDVVVNDIVLLAVPWKAVPEVLKGIADWKGHILVDATNPFIKTNPAEFDDLHGRTSSEIVAAQAPGARFVKAFNNLTMQEFEKGGSAPGAQRVLFVSGDDGEAKQRVSSFIASIGFAALDLGGLQSGGAIQQAPGPLAGRPIALLR